MFNPDADKSEESTMLHDYDQGQYCMDKVCLVANAMSQNQWLDLKKLNFGLK